MMRKRQVKMKFNLFLRMSLVLIFTLQHCSSERLREQIYSSIEGGAGCFRRLNGTHQVGCSSSRNGDVGVIHMVRDMTDAYWLTQNATAGPYMAVISTLIFPDVIEIFMNHPENIAGILIYHNETISTSAFTHDSQCPNQYASAPESSCPSKETGVWNVKGTNLMRRDIPFPMLYLPEKRVSEIQKIEKCFERFNNVDVDNQKGRPLCSMQLNTFMYAAVDTTVCLRRSASSSFIHPTKVCDPLGSQSVYNTLFPRVKDPAASTKPVILVTARLDAASLFDGVSPGAASAAVGMVTMITAAAALSKMIPNDTTTYEHNVFWTLFNGEVFDYIGSQRVAYDILGNQFPQSAPLSPTQIPLHIELGQLGGSLLSHNDDETWPLWMYSPLDANVDKVQDIFTEMTSNLNQFNISLKQSSTNNLPPSSLHSFRRILKNHTNSGELTEMVIVDHQEEFTNIFYNSAIDNNKQIGFAYHNISYGDDGTFITTDELIANGIMKRTEAQVKIAYLATAVARTLYKKVVGTSYAGNLAVSAHLVDEMLHCMVETQDCRLYRAVDYAGNSHTNVAKNPAPLYVSVNTWVSGVSTIAGHLLALLTGNLIEVDRKQCNAIENKQDYSYFFLKGWNNTSICIQTTTNFSQAISPAFVKENYDFKSGEFSSWSESVWQTMSARVFVSAGGGGALAAVAAGSCATIVVAFLTYWLKRHAQIIFINAPTASLVSADTTTGILRTVNC